MQWPAGRDGDNFENGINYVTTRQRLNSDNLLRACATMLRPIVVWRLTQTFTFYCALQLWPLLGVIQRVAHTHKHMQPIIVIEWSELCWYFHFIWPSMPHMHSTHQPMELLFSIARFEICSANKMVLMNCIIAIVAVVVHTASCTAFMNMVNFTNFHSDDVSAIFHWKMNEQKLHKKQFSRLTSSWRCCDVTRFPVARRTSKTLPLLIRKSHQMRKVCIRQFNWWWRWQA